MSPLPGRTEPPRQDKLCRLPNRDSNSLATIRRHSSRRRSSTLRQTIPRIKNATRLISQATPKAQTRFMMAFGAL